MLEEPLCRQIARLPPIKDRLGDIRRKIAEADEPSEIGPADTFALGKCSKGEAVGADECRVEPLLYFPFPFPFGAACDSADPAAVFDFGDVLPSRSTLDAARAALGLVFLLPLFAIDFTFVE
jgi:hypothetical protein